MGEIVYKFFFIFMIIIFFSFWFMLKLKQQHWLMYHWLDFVGIYSGFRISTWDWNYHTTGIIYVYHFPNACKWENKNTLSCLSALKKEWGMYNGLLFFSWNNLLK